MSLNINFNVLNDKFKELSELERTPVAIKWSVYWKLL